MKASRLERQAGNWVQEKRERSLHFLDSPAILHHSPVSFKDFLFRFGALKEPGLLLFFE
jgi:hypothetical protein